MNVCAAWWRTHEGVRVNSRWLRGMPEEVLAMLCVSLQETFTCE